MYTKKDLQQAYQNGVESVEVFGFGKCFIIGLGVAVGYAILIALL